MVYNYCINNKISYDNCCVLCKKNTHLSIKMKKSNHIYCIQRIKEQRENVVHNCPACIKDIFLFLNVTHHKNRKILASKL